MRQFHPGSSSRKDLKLIGEPSRIILVDDSDVAVEGQAGSLVRVPSFSPPYGPDDVLEQTLVEIRRRANAAYV